MTHEEITEMKKLEKELLRDIKNFILNKKPSIKELREKLDRFFRNRFQNDFDYLSPKNIRLFYRTKEILDNFKGTEIEVANLDYVYSFGKKPIKYFWKCSNFNLEKEQNEFYNILKKLITAGNFNKENAKLFFEFIDKIIGSNWMFEEADIINKTKDVYVLIDFDETSVEPEVNIFLVTNKANKKILEILPKNDKCHYVNPSFKIK